MAKKIVIAVDFDGVLAYNPFRVIRAPVTFVKRTLLGEKKTRFYIPRTPVEQLIWKILHESSVFPANGARQLEDLVESGKVEAHLVTARYSFLQSSLNGWLDRYRLRHIFSSINMNMRDEQPHIHKEQMLKSIRPDYFIEDNWDIVEYLNGRTKTKVMWIYNITDRGKEYPNKYPYLRKALESISG